MENENLSRLGRQTGHAELVSASSTQAVKSFFTEILCRGTGITKRQTPDYNLGGKRRGFTLIELLVVVLIIGILAAVAVPQYQKAVEKARLSEAIVIMRTIAKAHQLYYMENGEYLKPNEMDKLVIDIPGTPVTTDKRIQTAYFTYSPSGWISFGKATADLVYAVRVSEDGTALYALNITQAEPHKIQCYSVYSAASTVQRKLCHKIEQQGIL